MSRKFRIGGIYSLLNFGDYILCYWFDEDDTTSAILAYDKSTKYGWIELESSNKHLIPNHLIKDDLFYFSIGSDDLEFKYYRLSTKLTRRILGE